MSVGFSGFVGVWDVGVGGATGVGTVGGGAAADGTMLIRIVILVSSCTNDLVW